MLESLAARLLLFSALLIALRWLLTLKRSTSRSRPPLPPGPKKIPLIGNALQLAGAENLHETFAELAKVHGDVMHLKVFGQHIIVLDTLHASMDLLLNRSINYSDRIPSPMLNELTGWDEWEFGIMSGPVWREHRALFNQHFNRTAVKQYLDVQYIETLRTLQLLLQSPEQFRHHIKHLASAAIMKIVYGINIKYDNDPFVTLAEETIDALIQTAIPGAFMVDFFPILKYMPSWMPGAGFQKTAVRWRKAADNLRHVPFDDAKSDIINGNRPNSVVANLLRAGDGSSEYEKLAQDVAAIAYLGGADTTTSSLSMFFLAMALSPEVQLNAREELESVIGRDRLPTIDDRPQLPYIEAIVKETLRWYPVLSLGQPHMAAADDEYRGYFIPRGAAIIPNFWSMFRNESYYSNASEFRPERFLKDGKLDPNVLDPTKVGFGFGRRKCPGRYMADAGIFLFVASVLACFSVEPVKDEAGRPVPIKAVMSQGLISYPAPFKCKIIPRSGSVSDLIKRTLEDYQEKVIN